MATKVLKKMWNKREGFLIIISIVLLAIVVLIAGCASKSTVPFGVDYEKPKVDARKRPVVTIAGEKVGPETIKEIVKQVDAVCRHNGSKGIKRIRINYMSILDKAELSYDCIENK